MPDECDTVWCCVLCLFMFSELQLLDPHENWAFLSWLLDERRLQFIEKVGGPTSTWVQAT